MRRANFEALDLFRKVAMHGYTVAQSIQRLSNDVLRVEEGALYPALHRLEVRGLLRSEWGVSENNRRAKYSAWRHRAAASSSEKRRRGVASRWQSIASCRVRNPGGIMPFLGEWTRRLLALVHRGRLERDLDDELAFHMAMREAEHPIPMSTGPSSTLRFLESADQA